MVIVTVNAFDAATLTQTAGTGTTTFDGAVNTTGAGGIDLNGNIFTINDTIDTANDGGLSVTNAGQLTLAAGGDLGLDGVFLQDGAGSVQTAGDITTTNDNITFQQDVTLTGDVVLSTGVGISDVHFLDTIDGNFDLDITTGIGSVTWDAAIGGTVR